MPNLEETLAVYKKQNPKIALETVAAKKDKPSRYLVGVRYEEGIAVSADAADASRWFQLAAGRGRQPPRRYPAATMGDRTVQAAQWAFAKQPSVAQTGTQKFLAIASDSAPSNGSTVDFSFPSPQQINLVINPGHPHFRDIRVRRAFADVIASLSFQQRLGPTGSQATGSLFGSTPFAVPNDSALPPSIAAVRTELTGIEPLIIPKMEPSTTGQNVRTHLRAAISKLEQAGFSRRDGQVMTGDGPWELEILTSVDCAYQPSADLRQKCTMVDGVGAGMASQLSRLGIKTKVRIVNRDQFMSRQNARDFAILLDFQGTRFSRSDIVGGASVDGSQPIRSGDGGRQIWREAMGGLPDRVLAFLSGGLSVATDIEKVKEATRAIDTLAQSNSTVLPVVTWHRTQAEVDASISQMQSLLKFSQAATSSPPPGTASPSTTGHAASGIPVTDYQAVIEALRTWRQVDVAEFSDLRRRFRLFVELGSDAEKGNADAQFSLAQIYAAALADFPKDAAKAAELYRKAAERGHKSAPYYLGLSYQFGEGVPASEAQAIEWYRKSAERGDERAKKALADLGQATGPNAPSFEDGLAAYDRGDNGEAFRIWRILAEQGHAEAQSRLANLYETGRGTARDSAEALRLYRSAAGNGHAQASDDVARLEARLAAVTSAGSFDDGQSAYDRGDFSEALRIWRPLAEGGYAEAQLELGTMYSRGEGVPKDSEQAEAWRRRAAEQGDAWAQYLLGLSLIGDPTRINEGLDWFRRASDQGLESATEELVMFQNLGIGEDTFDDGMEAYNKRDYPEALRIWRVLAERGMAVAQNNLGVMYNKGHGVPKDDAQAMAWYTKAAEQGDADGNANLCSMHIVRNKGAAPKASGYCYQALIKGDDEILKYILNDGNTPGFRRSIQQHLRDDGFYSGTIDGSFGSGTKRALKAAFNSKPDR